MTESRTAAYHSALDTVDFFTDNAVLHDPYEYLAAMHEECPVRRRTAMPFEETTAIVTGGASGLGLAITEALAARGTKVAVFDVQAEQLHAQVSLLTDEGATVSGYVVDASNRAEVENTSSCVRTSPPMSPTKSSASTEDGEHE